MANLPYFGSNQDAFARALAEAERMRELGLLPPLPTTTHVQCACGAGCTDGVCTAQELGEDG